MNAFKYYSDDIVSWDLVLKNPFNNDFFFRDNISKGKLYMSLMINNENDFKIIKFLEFLNKLLESDSIKVFIKKNYSNVNKRVSVVKKVVCSVIIRNLYLFKLLENLFTIIFSNINKKRIPIKFGLDVLNGIFMLKLKDIGEIGLLNLKYDYFAWQSDFVINLYLNKKDYYFMNLIVSYLNFTLRV